MDKQRVVKLLKEDQGSQGDLKEQQNRNFQTEREVIGELDIDEIQPYTEIPDYKEPTISKNPIVVKAPASSSCYCIDGWTLIEEAKERKLPKIACYAFYLPQCSPIELAIRKTVIRTLPQGGRSLYPELIRNTTSLYRMLLEMRENPVIFSHGGARRGAVYTNNLEDNIRTLLSERLGKAVTTISKYLSYAQYLSAEAMETLVESKANKDFFEKVQGNKRILIKNLRHDRESDENITATISQAMLDYLQEYHRTGKIESVVGGSQDGEGDSAPDVPQENNPVSRQMETFKHWSGNVAAQQERPIAFEDLQRELKAVWERLAPAISPEITPNQFEEILRAEIANMVNILKKLTHLNRSQDSPTAEEAA